MVYRNDIKQDFYTTFNTDLVAIESALISFADDLSGHIGMAPGDQDNSNDVGNFMEKLIDSKIIDHHIFAIYIHESKNRSFIKFGNYD
jgi:hypothetical protein